ncbi:beta strand repeat-containing protein [Fontivita pretiosa]|uniref:beta strand repeat-containing protein n=1 Tax=Fontivita pretiosa TaxID=2989684 RepID=UPI003D168432
MKRISRCSRTGRAPGAIVAAAIGLSAANLGYAQVSGSWISLSGGSWSVGANWSSNPAYPDSGGVATIGVGSVLIRLDTHATLAQLNFQAARGTSIRPSLSGARITLTGAGVIDTAFAFPASGAGSTISASIDGSVGLTKTGPGLLVLDGANTYTGGTCVKAGILAASDAALGAASGSVVLDGGALTHVGSSNLITRNVMVSPSGGGLFQARSFTDLRFAGVLSGAGPFSFLGNGSLYLSADSPFRGTFRAASGAAAIYLRENAALRSVPAFELGGMLSLDNRFTAKSDRIGDSANIVLNGGALELRGSQTLTERVGAITLGRGVNYLTGSSAATLAASALVRQNRSVAVFSLLPITLDTPPALVGGGGPAGSPEVSIVPWAFAGPSSSSAGLVTYDAGGLRALGSSEYLWSIPAGSITTANVALKSATFTLTAPATVNALTLAASTISLLGSSTITITSGVILNNGRSNTIATPIDFGSAEGLIHVHDGTLTLSGTLSGRNGLTVSQRASSSPSHVVLCGVNTYSGSTTLNGGSIWFGGSVLPNTPGPFGSDSSPIVLNESAVLYNTSLYTASTATSIFARDLIVRSDLDPFTPRHPSISGSSTAVSGNVLLEGVLGADGTTFTGTIFGPGAIRTGSATFTGTNTFTGGIWNTGIVFVGSDRALGTGTVVCSSMSDSGFFPAATLTAVGGARTLTNPFVIGALVFSGSFSTTLAGPVKLNGGPTAVRVSGAEATISGPISDGMLLHSGGHLTLSGYNSQYATSINQNGTLTVASSFGLGGAGGTMPLLTSVGTLGALELTGGIAIPAHRLEIASSGSIGLRSIAGNNIWSGDVVRTLNPLRIGVDADSLRIGGELDLNNGPLIKLGAGTLEVGHLRTVGTISIDTGTIRIRPNGTDAGVSKVAALSIAGGANPIARLDVTNNDLIVDYTGDSPLATIRAQIASAHAGGAWNGEGITSSLADATTHALGLATSADLFGDFPATFSGQSVDSTAALVKFTYYGDADLSGAIDATDYSLIDNGYVNNLPGWINGDFDYSGAIDATDYALIDHAYVNQSGVPAGATIAKHARIFGGAYLRALAALQAGVIPEPGMCHAGALGIVGVLVRRGRRERIRACS